VLFLLQLPVIPEVLLLVQVLLLLVKVLPLLLLPLTPEVRLILEVLLLLQVLLLLS